MNLDVNASATEDSANLKKRKRVLSSMKSNTLEDIVIPEAEVTSSTPPSISNEPVSKSTPVEPAFKVRHVCLGKLS